MTETPGHHSIEKTGFYSIACVIASLAMMMLMVCGIFWHIYTLSYASAFFCVLLIICLVEYTPHTVVTVRATRSEEGEPRTFFSYFALGAFACVALALVLLPNFLRARAGGCFTACNSNLKNIGTACEMYSSDNCGHYPPALSNLTPRYLQTLPTCHAAGHMTYAYVSGTRSDTYTIWCKGSPHVPMVSQDYPQYNSIHGIIY
jgi:hypothetical protein